MASLPVWWHGGGRDVCVWTPAVRLLWTRLIRLRLLIMRSWPLRRHLAERRATIKMDGRGWEVAVAEWGSVRARWSVRNASRRASQLNAGARRRSSTNFDGEYSIMDVGSGLCQSAVSCWNWLPWTAARTQRNGSRHWEKRRKRVKSPLSICLWEFLHFSTPYSKSQLQRTRDWSMHYPHSNIIPNLVFTWLANWY